MENLRNIIFNDEKVISQVLIPSLEIYVGLLAMFE